MENNIDSWTNMNPNSFSADDFASVVFAMFFNCNLKIYDNGLSIAENYINNIANN